MPLASRCTLSNNSSDTNLSCTPLTVISDSVPFDTFLQLISENNIKDISEDALEIDETLDWIDDTLLSLHSLHNENAENIDYSWVETFFRKSLAFIQISDKSVITGTQFLDIIKNRVEGIVSKVGTDKRKWLSLIKSGIPLNSDLMIEDKLVSIIDTIRIFSSLDNDINNKIDLLKTLETILIDIPVLEEDNIESNAIDKIRTLWLSGAQISSILPYENALDLITKIYTFKLPWVFNGIAKKTKKFGNGS